MFDPSAHLTKIQGKDYLEVKWRLVFHVRAAPSLTAYAPVVVHGLLTDLAC